jgi:hypothetical protein
MISNDKLFEFAFATLLDLILNFEVIAFKHLPLFAT